MLDSQYLYEPVPGPLANLRYAYLALTLIFALGLALNLSLYAFWGGGRDKKNLLFLEAGLCTLGLLLIASRFANLPVLSARAFLYGLILGAVAAPWGFRFQRLAGKGWVLKQLRLLSFNSVRSEQGLPLEGTGLLATVHLLGLTALWLYFNRPPGQSLLLAFLSLLLLLSPQILLSLHRRSFTLYLEALTPLVVPYALLFLRPLLAITFRLVLPSYDGFSPPNLWAAGLSVEALSWASLTYVILCQVDILLVEMGRRKVWLAVGGAFLLAFAFLWAGAEYFLYRTQGVTGSDPYAYVQMAVDLVRRGTPLHLFDLFPRVSGLGVSWWPVVHVGYHLPLDAAGSAATVWPPGGSGLLALGYLLLGERGFYLTTPLVGLLAMVATFALSDEVLRGRGRGERLLGGALAAFLLATSYEQVDRVLVPMTDVPAQLFSVLTILFALKGCRERAPLYALLAGLSFGLAYLVRHTQLVLGLSVLVVLALKYPSASWRRRVRFLFPFGAASLLVALPDLLYHHLVFGHFLRPESLEWQLYSLAAVGRSALQLTEAFLAGNEFGFLLPLILYGAYRLYREARGHFFVLGSWLLSHLAIHLPYPALRLRDLLPAFPPLVILAVYGLVALLSLMGTFRVRSGLGSKLTVAAACFALLTLFSWRGQGTLLRPFAPHQATFGYLRLEQRRAFTTLAQHTEPASVVGTTLNGGPIDLYAGRLPFRPAPWTDEELGLFLEAMSDQGLAIYLLFDGVDLIPSLQYIRQHYRVSAVTRLDVPFYGNVKPGAGTLYRIERRDE
ncbi:MAG: glycosyltransferase family 39 protein [Anaerolineae bacterium]